MRVCLALLFLVAHPVFADDAEDALLAEIGDAEYGEYLASECTACHQASGEVDGIPSIIGWDEESFRLSMHDYRVKTRQHPVMNMIAERLGDEEIAALSAYFAKLNGDNED